MPLTPAPMTTTSWCAIVPLSRGGRLLLVISSSCGMRTGACRLAKRRSLYGWEREACLQRSFELSTVWDAAFPREKSAGVGARSLGAAPRPLGEPTDRLISTTQENRIVRDVQDSRFEV